MTEQNQPEPDPSWPLSEGATYEMTLDFDVLAQPLRCVVHFPHSVNGKTVTLGAFQTQRPAQLTVEQRAFRDRLLRAIGTVTLEAGRAEADMKRLLLIDSGSFDFATVDLMWTPLWKRVERLGDRDERVAELMRWATAERITQRRHNVVHAQWWDVYDGNAVRSRMAKKADAAPMIGRIEDVEVDAERLAEFAERLEGIIGRRWPLAVFSELPAE